MSQSPILSSEEPVRNKYSLKGLKFMLLIS